MLDKLTQMKQELTTSSVRCENLGSMDSLDQTEAALTDSISQLADKVNAMIHEAISQVRNTGDLLRKTGILVTNSTFKKYYHILYDDTRSHQPGNKHWRLDVR